MYFIFTVTKDNLQLQI